MRGCMLFCEKLSMNEALRLSLAAFQAACAAAVSLVVAAASSEAAAGALASNAISV